MDGVRQVSAGDSGGSYVHSLPPNVPTLKELRDGFNVGGTSTEQSNEKTEQLSQTMKKDIKDGLGLFLDVSEGVAKGVSEALPAMKQFAGEVAEAKRIFLVGAGSSGRAGLNLADRCRHAFPEHQQRVVPVIVAGDSALIQARESGEDSKVEGRETCESFDIGEGDVVFLISASGSATFNVNFGEEASARGAKVIYFHNSERVVEQTQKLFELPTNPVIPFCVDIGAAAITGSTRLDAADLAEAVLGGILASAFSQSEAYLEDLADKLEQGNQQIRRHLEEIAGLVKASHAIYASPNSDFRRPVAVYKEGYITGLALPTGGREAVIDCVELKPTYGVRGIRTREQGDEKPAPYRVYILGSEGWRAALGREPRESDREDASQYILASEDAGETGYNLRPKGPGNLTIGIGRLGKGPLSTDLIEELKAVKGKKALILTMTRKLTDEERQSLSGIPHVVCIDELPEDSLGLVEGIVLKRVLNLVSNGSMVLSDKVFGNLMIDLKLANNKLVLRAMGLVQSIWADRQRARLSWNEDLLYHNAVWVRHHMRKAVSEGRRVPSAVRILLAMALKNKTADDFEEIVDFLSDKEGPLDWLAA